MQTNPVGRWIDTALDFVFPPFCLSCATVRDSDKLLCDRCAAIVQYLEYPICLACTSPLPDGLMCTRCSGGLPLFALGDHMGPLQQMVIALKFRNVHRVADWAAEQLLQRQKLRIAELQIQVVMPIPLHSRREYMRGYNQAELFGEHLAESLGVELRDDLIFRTKHRREQSRLTAQERATNIKGVFQAEYTDELQQGILLVDDVVTSGATVNEAVRVLKEKGHGVIGVAAIAHRP